MLKTKLKTKHRTSNKLKIPSIQLIEKLALPLEEPAWYPTAVDPGQRINIKAIVDYLNINPANKRKAVLLIRAYDEAGDEVDVSFDRMAKSEAFDAHFKYLASTQGETEELYTFIVPEGVTTIHFGFNKFLCSENEQVIVSDLTVYPEIETEIIESPKKLETPKNYHIEKLALPLEEPVWYPTAAEPGQRISIKAIVEYLNINPANKRKAVLLIRAYDEAGEEVDVSFDKMAKSEVFDAHFKYLASIQGEAEELYTFIVPEGVTTIHFGFNRFLCSGNEQVIVSDITIYAEVKNYANSNTLDNKSIVEASENSHIKNSEPNSVYSMLIEFEENNSFLSNIDKARKLILLSKTTDTKSSCIIAGIAANLNQDAFTLTGYAWACIHCKDYYKAIEILSHLQRNKLTNEKQIESLGKALSSRLSDEDIERYSKEFRDGSSVDSVAKLKETSATQLDEYQKLYKKKDYNSIADMIFDKFKNDSVDDIIKFIKIDLKNKYKFSDSAIILIMIKTSKRFGEYKNNNTEIKLIEESIQIKKSPLTMRAAFWAYNRKGSVSKSRETLNWLESYANEKKDIKLLDFVESRIDSYLFLTSKHFLQLIEEAKENRIEEYKPNAETIAYVLHNSLPYASGGYATRGHGLATALAKNGYDVSIITRPGFPLETRKELTPSDVSDLQNIDGVAYHTILEPRRDQLPTFEYIKQAAAKLIEKFEIIKPSLVVGASNHLTALPALIAARKLGIPFIYEVRGFWEVTRISREPEFEHTEWYELLCSFEALTASQADYVFTLTTPMAEELERRGVNKDRITILPNSCNPERFEPASRNIALSTKLSIPTTVPVIGYIGTFVQYEGLEHLAEACGILKQKGVEFRLLVVGNENTAGNDKGSITQNIMDVAVQYGFEDWLIMPGRIPHEEVEAYYSLIDIAPFPRKPQPVTEMVSPMKPLEAAAMKKAIVVSSVRALTDMITDGENGLVFEKGNIGDLASKLLQLVENNDYRNKLGENARFWVEKERTWDQTVEKLNASLRLL